MALRTKRPPAAEPIHLDAVKLQHKVTLAAEDPTLLKLIKAAREHVERASYTALVTQTLELVRTGFPATNAPIFVPKPPLQTVLSIKYLDTAGVEQTLAAADYLVDTSRLPGRIHPAYATTWPSTRDQAATVTIRFTAGFVTPITVDPATDIVTWLGRSPANGEVVILENSGGYLPGGLAEKTAYYAVNVAGATCKLSLTEGGAPIDITSAGTGTSFAGELPEIYRQAMEMVIGFWYENRSAVNIGNIVNRLPYSLEDLVPNYRRRTRQ